MLALDLNKVVHEEFLRSRNEAFPFKTSVSLRPLIRYWREIAKGESPMAKFARQLAGQANAVAELHDPNLSLAIIEKNKELVEQLMSCVFPEAFRESDCTAAVMPFSMFPFLVTQNFNDTFISQSGQFTFVPVQGNQIVEQERAISAYVSIAARIYGFVVRRPRPRLVYTTIDPKTGLRKFYDFFIATRFIEVLTQGEIPALTETKKKFLQKNLRSMEAWVKTLPTEHFEFSGFSFVRAIDVTMQEVITNIKQILIDKDSITSEKSFRSLEENICTLLQRPGLELRLTIFLGRNAARYSCLKNMHTDSLMEDYLSDRRATSLKKFVERATADGEITLINKDDVNSTRMELDMRWLNSKVEYEILAPLRYQGTLIGFLELGSTEPIMTNEYHLSVLNEILPLVSVAAKRSFDELQSSVQNIIRERCTAIHPSIEWRFEKAAFSLVSTHNRHLPMETIEFKNVYPLYAFTDICSSSAQRNGAIRKDLIEELQFLREVLMVAQRTEPMPMVNMFLYRVDNWLDQLRKELSAGDDLSIEAALTNEIMPFVDDLRGMNKDFAEAVAKIESTQNGRLSVTSARETFEDSLLKLNDALSRRLDEEQEKAQRLCAHYYEKRVTDGVEHSVYAGGTISEHNSFSRTSLRNLRLWQLLTTIKLEQLSQSIKPTLAVPLETAHCVVVQDTPLDIHFKYDEKRFGVSGLANIRFEIIKKRVEKALVNNGSERLTQPGHLAIVYSQDKEKVDYLQFIDYLQHMNLLEEKVEDLELDNTAELRGLKALRVKIRS